MDTVIVFKWNVIIALKYLNIYFQANINNIDYISTFVVEKKTIIFVNELKRVNNDYLMRIST